jgi:hypothetical protein
MALNYIFKTCTHMSNKYARFIIIIYKKLNIYYKQAIPFSETQRKTVFCFALLALVQKQ